MSTSIKTFFVEHILKTKCQMNAFQRMWRRNISCDTVAQNERSAIWSENRISGAWWRSVELWCIFLLVKQAVEQTIELPVIWNAIALMWRHSDGTERDLACSLTAVSALCQFFLWNRERFEVQGNTQKVWKYSGGSYEWQELPVYKGHIVASPPQTKEQ